MKLTRLFLILAIGACSGRDGTIGPAGPEGPAGPTGATGPSGPPGALTGTLAGTVLTDAGPVAGAAVSTVPATQGVTTGADGKFDLGVVPVGIYRVAATHAGLEPAAAEGVSVVVGQRTEVTLRLSPPSLGTIRGTVRFTDGTPAPGVSVSTDRHRARTVTDEAGAYTLQVKPTTYAVIATAYEESYRAGAANDVQVTAGGEVVVNLTLVASPLGSATFIGSSACAECHTTHYDRWGKSLHANTIRYVDDPSPSLGGVVAEWSGTHTLERAPGVSYQAELVAESGQFHATLIDATGGRRTYTVVRVMGGGAGWRQLFHVRQGSLHQVLPLQWNEVTRAWVPYQAEYWFNADGSARQPGASESFEQNCVGCHTTGLRVEESAGGVVSSATVTETRIGCEACHGPGSKHALSRNKADIVNPRRLITKTAGVFDMTGSLLDGAAYDGFLRASEACGRCHQRGTSNAASDFRNSYLAGTHGYPYIAARGGDGAYQPGEPLAWYFKDGGDRWGDTIYDVVNSSRLDTQQWGDMLEAARVPGTHAKNPYDLVTCFDCHAAHGSSIRAQLRQTSKDNVLCLSCHGGHGPFAPAAGETVNDAARRHTRHNYAPATTGSGRCTGCHMPRTAQSAVPRDISSHTFAIVQPHESRDMKAAGKVPIPNSCDQCHRDDQDLGVLRYQVFFGLPSPVTP